MKLSSFLSVGSIIISAAPKAFKRRESLNAINLLNRAFALNSDDSEIEKEHYKMEKGYFLVFKSLPFSGGTKTAAAIVVVHKPFLSPAAD